MGRLFMIEVRYQIRSGKRSEFYDKIREYGIDKASRTDSGNLRYEFFLPTDSDNELFLSEMWIDEPSQISHCDTEHFQKIQLLKDEYVENIELKKYWIEEY
ncbi:MAG: antibiotic biosynthesis monooxygenase [Lachnospiraceae bacterium]|nr:antibiotic biosynthesis monooxygenase [Lachnospiraceae bacterium]